MIILTLDLQNKDPLIAAKASNDLEIFKNQYRRMEPYIFEVHS